MSRKLWICFLLIAFFVGALGSIIMGRFFIPYLATFPGFQGLNKLVTNSPIVVNRTQEVRLNEGVNLIELTKQAGSSTVSLYSADATPAFLGNGVVMTSDGLIFTSKAVVGTKAKLTAVLNNGTKYEALVRAADPKSDVIALTINANNLTTASFEDAADLEVGMRVVAIGESNNPFDRSFETGYVTSTVANTVNQLSRNFTTEVLEESFETNAVLNNPRFVGSPIINLNGKLVGMVSGSSIQKIVIAENLQTALNAYLANGKIVRPRLGLSYFNISPTMAALRGLDRTGVLVARADEASPALGKLLPNDLIFAVDGQNLDNQSFEQIINRHAAGEITFRVIRAGQEQEIKINLVPTK